MRPLGGDEPSPRKLRPPQRHAPRRDDETRSSRVRPHRASQPFARRKGNGTCPGDSPLDTSVRAVSQGLSLGHGC